MPTKDGRQQQEPAIHPYELLRLKKCMRNNARLQELGLVDEPDGNTSKNTTKASKKITSKRAADMPLGGMKTRHKRVLVAQPTTRTTRSKRSLTVQLDDTSTGFSTGGVAPSNQVEEISSNFDNHNLTEGDVPHQPVDIAQAVNHSRMANGSAETAVDNHISQQNEERQDDTGSEGGEGRCIRGINMGKGLQKLSRARGGKLAVIIPDGKIRPLVPLVAAKFATECNIAVRNHVPVLQHWKEYKNQPGHLKNFLLKLGAKFDINTNDDPTRNACCQMMKSALRQQRYRLKKKYFDPFPLSMVSKTSPVKSMTDEQWNQLVEGWKNPIKMTTCEKNKANRAKVKFHQTTGSRSYMVHCENLGENYNDEDPNALDLFKECHYSKKKKGYTSSVQSAIDEMEKKIAEADGAEQEHMSVSEVVANVLAQHTKRNKFLQNVGIQDVQPRTSVRNLQEQLAEEKRANAELRLVVNNQREQIGVLSDQVYEAEQARVKDKEEMQKKQAETDAKLDLLLSQLRSAQPEGRCLRKF